LETIKVEKPKENQVEKFSTPVDLDAIMQSQTVLLDCKDLDCKDLVNKVWKFV
jgi:hypothetical protein